MLVTTFTCFWLQRAVVTEETGSVGINDWYKLLLDGDKHEAYQSLQRLRSLVKSMPWEKLRETIAAARGATKRDETLVEAAAGKVVESRIQPLRRTATDPQRAAKRYTVTF